MYESSYLQVNTRHGKGFKTETEVFSSFKSLSLQVIMLRD